MDEARSFSSLLIVVMLAFLVPLLLSSIRGRLAIPIVLRCAEQRYGAVFPSQAHKSENLHIRDTSTYRSHAAMYHHDSGNR